MNRRQLLKAAASVPVAAVVPAGAEERVLLGYQPAPFEAIQREMLREAQPVLSQYRPMTNLPPDIFQAIGKNIGDTLDQLAFDVLCGGRDR